MRPFPGQISFQNRVLMDLTRLSRRHHPAEIPSAGLQIRPERGLGVDPELHGPVAFGQVQNSTSIAYESEFEYEMKYNFKKSDILKRPELNFPPIRFDLILEYRVHQANRDFPRFRKRN